MIFNFMDKSIRFTIYYYDVTWLMQQHNNLPTAEWVTAWHGKLKVVSFSHTTEKKSRLCFIGAFFFFHLMCGSIKKKKKKIGIRTLNHTLYRVQKSTCYGALYYTHPSAGCYIILYWCRQARKYFSKTQGKLYCLHKNNSWLWMDVQTNEATWLDSWKSQKPKLTESYQIT